MLEATARAEDTHFWFRGLRRTASRLLRDAIGHRPVTHIIDCGAGTGRNLDWLAGFGPAFGVELSPFGLHVARSRRRPVVRATVAHLPFADGIADLVTSFDVLYCLDDDTEGRAVQEMLRVLKPGGWALINTAALDVLRGAHSTLTMERRRYTKGRLSRLLTRHGFAIRRLTYTNMATFPLTLAVRVKDRLTGHAATASDADLQVPIRPVNGALNALLAVESGLTRLVNLPIGSSLLCLAQKPRS
jgi:SAM-dependent methyltransferase